MKMEISYRELKGDFESLLKFIKGIESDFAKGKINEKRFDILPLQYSKSNALIKLKKFDEGSKFLDKMLRDIDDTSRAWYAFAEKLRSPPQLQSFLRMSAILEI